MTLEKNKQDFYDLFERMNDQKIIIAYHGEISYEVVNMLLQQAKYDMRKREIPRRTFKKTYDILVECLENFLRHSSEVEEEESPKEGILVLGHYNNNYYISIANLIAEEDVKIVKSKMEEISNMSKEELMKKRKEILKQGLLTKRGGAGLGLLNIARSGNEIHHFFHEHENGKQLFTLQAVVNNEQ